MKRSFNKALSMLIALCMVMLCLFAGLAEANEGGEAAREIVETADNGFDHTSNESNLSGDDDDDNGINLGGNDSSDDSGSYSDSGSSSDSDSSSDSGSSDDGDYYGSFDDDDEGGSGYEDEGDSGEEEDEGGSGYEDEGDSGNKDEEGDEGDEKETTSDTSKNTKKNTNKSTSKNTGKSSKSSDSGDSTVVPNSGMSALIGIGTVSDAIIAPTGDDYSYLLKALSEGLQPGMNDQVVRVAVYSYNGTVCRSLLIDFESQQYYYDETKNIFQNVAQAATKGELTADTRADALEIIGTTDWPVSNPSTAAVAPMWEIVIQTQQGIARYSEGGWDFDTETVLRDAMRDLYALFW